MPTLKGKKKKKRNRHFPLLPTVKVLALSPKQPHACGSNHALSFFCINVKVQFNLFDKYGIASGWAKFLALKPSWCISRLWHAGWNDFGWTILRKVKFYLRHYFSFYFPFRPSLPSPTLPPLQIHPTSLFLYKLYHSTQAMLYSETEGSFPWKCAICFLELLFSQLCVCIW